jgi:hypothetical protein
MRRGLHVAALSLLSALLAAALSACGCSEKREDLVAMRVGGHAARVEIADTPDLRNRGLMYREKLGEDEGMLFVYPSPRVVSFWMKNTRIPLSIAFIDERRRIVRIAHMRPFDESEHSSVVRVPYALEMNRGWFARHGVKPGDRVDLPEEALRSRAAATP